MYIVSVGAFWDCIINITITGFPSRQLYVQMKPKSVLFYSCMFDGTARAGECDTPLSHQRNKKTPLRRKTTGRTTMCLMLCGHSQGYRDYTDPCYKPVVKLVFNWKTREPAIRNMQMSLN